MKALIILLTIAWSALAIADDIPVREPKVGEPRPTWWLSCWMDYVVVVEGSISVLEDDKPDVTVEIDPQAADRFFNQDDRDLQKAFSSFYLARLKPKKLLFASPGITSSNLNIAGINTGETKDLIILVPLMKSSNGKFIAVMGGRDKQEGVFILRYGSMLTKVPLVFDDVIPHEKLKSAEMVFKHRDRFDHRMHNYKEAAEQAGGRQAPQRPDSE